MTETLPRRLRRNDVVVPLRPTGGLFYGRVWRRFDADHVLVVDTGQNVTLYRDDELAPSDYTGRWKWQRHPGNAQGHAPRWSAMTSLKRLKKLARDYNAHFGGLDGHGRPWSKAAIAEANANPRRHVPREIDLAA